METEQRIFDPRAGLWLLIGANVIAFRPHTFWLELALIGLLLALMLVHRRFAMAIKWAVGYCALVVFQQFILPVSPMIIATSFTIFATYTRRMFPCLMTGALMLTCTPLRYLIVALRQLHIPQKLIVAISVTLRYFPAIREEVGYIRDAMKLRNIRGLDRLECTVMPLMVSATETAEEYFRTEFPQYAGELGTLFSVYSEDEVRTLFELMMRMYAGLDKLEALTLKGEEEK